MTQEKVSPLRARMMEDMRIRGMQEASQKAHIRALKDFTAFLGRSPDTATPEELRAYQLHITNADQHWITEYRSHKQECVFFRTSMWFHLK